MSRFIRPFLFVLVAGVVLIGVALWPLFLVKRFDENAPPMVMDSGEFSAQQQADIEGITRRYMLAHPELLRDMAAALQAQESVEANAKLQTVFDQYRETIYNSPREVVVGNPKGDVTLVEFFDYNCGYCKRALSDLLNLLDKDKNLRVVLKEFPVLSPGSHEAARVAVAVHRLAPEKYIEFHKHLLGGDVPADGATALNAAVNLGLDPKKLMDEVKGPDVEATIAESMDIAKKLNIDGTPSYVIGDTVVPGAIGAKGLAEMVGNVRKCGKVTCS